MGTVNVKVYRADAESAIRLYSEAYCITSMLYGHEDDDVVDTMRKCTELQETLFSMPRSSKRRRLRGKQSAPTLDTVEKSIADMHTNNYESAGEATAGAGA